MKKAIVIGSKGQDGRIAIQLMKERDYEIVGIERDIIEIYGKTSNEILNWNKKVDITDFKSVEEIVEAVKPDEIYFFAAYHHSSEDGIINELELIERSYKINVFSFANVLEAVKKYSPSTRVFYASSSLIFGNAQEEIQNENTICLPENIYGITKLDSMNLARYYRKNYGLFVSVGIFYNHESVYRTERFVTKKIIKSAIQIKTGKQEKLIVGDLNSYVDWGYAWDYVEAAIKILQLPEADEFIIASGEKHSVKEFIKIAFETVGLDWEKYVFENKELIKRTRKPMVGDYKKLKEKTGWGPSLSFEDMVKTLIKEEEKNISEVEIGR